MNMQNYRTLGKYRRNGFLRRKYLVAPLRGGEEEVRAGEGCKNAPSGGVGGGRSPESAHRL